MARKRKTPVPYIPVYYAYYDKKTGNILSVTNEKTPTYTDGIKISYEEFDKFVSGKEKFSDFLIGRVRCPGNKSVLSIIPAPVQTYTVKNNILEWITNFPSVDTELIVTWDTTKRNWVFQVSAECKDRLLLEMPPKKFIFFIMLKDDFDFLVRTIIIETPDLLNGQVKLDFVSKFEHDINNITIASNLFFESYGLQINK